MRVGADAMRQQVLARTATAQRERDDARGLTAHDVCGRLDAAAGGGEPNELALPESEPLGVASADTQAGPPDFLGQWIRTLLQPGVRRARAVPDCRRGGERERQRRPGIV